MGRNIVFLTVMFFMAVSVRAQELKLGFVNDRAILEKLPAKQEVQKILDQETVFWEQRFTDRRQLLKACLDSVKAVQTDLEKARADSAKAVEPEKQPSSPDSAANPSAQTDSSASPAKTGDSETAAAQDSSAPADTLELLATLVRLEVKLEKAKKEIVALYHRIYGENGALERRNAELSQSILEKISRSIAEVSQEDEVSFIFDSSVLLYIDQDYNYTEQVMEALNIEQQRAR
jgi:Skp family chaperone for outer membrane proteins